MPPETGARKPHAAMLKRFEDVAPFYEVTLTHDDELRFVCARCRHVFSYPASGRTPRHRAYLAAHLASHGVGPAMVPTSARRENAGRRGLDAAGRPDQTRFAFDHGDE